MPTYTAPTTRASGFLVTASVWNTDIVENIKYFKDAPVFDTAAIIGAATTAGIRLDLESGVLAVREGDDSAYGPMRSGILYVVGSAPAATPTWLSADSAVISGTTNNVLQMHSGTNSGSQAVAFSVGSTRSKAGYGYDNSNDALYFTTNSTERVRLTSGGVLHPSTNDAAALGNGTYQWSDLFLASGGVINFANGNVTLTHTTGTLTSSASANVLGGTRIADVSAFLSNSSDTLIGWASGFSGYTNGTLILQPRSSTGVPIVFATGATSATERMRITETGNVAIAATAKLYLDGTAGTGDTYIHEASANLVQFVVGGTGIFSAANNGTSLAPYIYAAGSNLLIDATKKLYLDGGGDTYITESASNDLTLVAGGNSYIVYDGGFYPSTDNARVLGTSLKRWSAVYAANGTIQTSDRTRKHNITDSDLGLDFVLALKPSRFTMNDEPEDSVRYGLIAQDVIQAAQGRSTLGMITGEQEGDYGLNYASLVTPLISAIHELHAELAALKARLN